MTKTQERVLLDIMFEGDPWAGVRWTDGVKISGRRKTIASLLKNDLIEISYNWQRAWVTRKGVCALREVGV